ncbi:hypothetical protein B005_0523 [Nocardiopsis alba ATCC BAA-2165]|uniref:Uncharacterized protein n=1 Tax=Nocardiopsis alba (strain ATCC BAA-2165 / BE74) TaxID=1205910 RepID=J7LCY0_NOCAA|nr:hypothetical protein B005_0523 [Nocardiopsis alba ATCC BAA-2165]
MADRLRGDGHPPSPPVLVCGRDPVPLGHPGKLNVLHRERSCPTWASVHRRPTRRGVERSPPSRRRGPRALSGTSPISHRARDGRTA